MPAQLTSRDHALDGLRGAAVLLVYIFHYGGGLTSANPVVRLFGYITQAGWIGVDHFFALSGFRLTRSFWADRRGPGCLRNFYARRALRILPLYFGALALAAIVARYNGVSLHALRPLLLYAAFLQNVPPFLGVTLHEPPPLPLYHLWSLAVEEQFYLLWPLLLAACKDRRQAFRLCLAGFVLCCLFRSVVFATAGHILHTPPQAWSLALPGRAGALALGSALALVPVGGNERLQRFAPYSVIVSLAGFLAVAKFDHGLLLNHAATVIFGLPCVEIFAAALVGSSAGALAARDRWRTLLGVRPLRTLGRISYGLYVFHILLEPYFDGIGSLLTHTTRGMAYQTVRLLVAFPVSVTVASLSYYALERPFLRLKRRFPLTA